MDQPQNTGSDESYRYLREHRPDLLRKCVEIGSDVLLLAPRPGVNHVLTMASHAERAAVAVVVGLLREHAADRATWEASEAKRSAPIVALRPDDDPRDPDQDPQEWLFQP